MKWAIKNDLLLWFLCFGPCALSGGEKLCVCVCLYTCRENLCVHVSVCKVCDVLEQRAQSEPVHPRSCFPGAAPIEAALVPSHPP